MGTLNSRSNTPQRTKSRDCIRDYVDIRGNLFPDISEFDSNKTRTHLILVCFYNMVQARGYSRLALHGIHLCQKRHRTRDDSW